MIVKNRLLNYGDNIIYQDNDYFNFSLDSVLLANFVNIQKKDINILDLCTGNAPIPMLLSFRTNCKIYAMEIQKEIYDLAVSSITENKMDKQISVINDDIKNVANYFKNEYFDIITCNPPYFKYINDSFVNFNDVKSIARHEIKITIEEIVKISSSYLKNKGKLYLVHRPERLVEIIEVMKKYKIEPKKVRFIYSKINTNSNMVLIEGIKNGNSGMKVLPPLITHEENGSYSIEVKGMFGDDYVAK